VAIPPPSYVPSAYDEHRLRLEVFDAAGRASVAEVLESTATYMVAGYDESGEE
jgi:hypothetical protein